MSSGFRKRKAAPKRMLGEETEVLVQAGPSKRYKSTSRQLARRPFGKASRKENKFNDVSQAAIEVNYDASYALALNVISQGDGIGNRDGNRIKVTGIQVKGYVKHQPGAGAVPQDSQLRLLLVYDKRPNLGGTSSISSVLTTSGVATDVYQLRNRASSLTGRYTVLKDHMFNVFDVSSPGAAATGISQQFEWFIPVQAITEYGANAGSSTDIQVGLISLVATSNLSAAGVGPTLEYRSRVSFEEL